MRRSFFPLTLALCAALAVAATAESAVKHRLLAADYSAKRIAILAPDGSIEWQQPVGDIHDLHLLPNGNILFQRTFQQLVEMDPRTNQVVWQYDAAHANGNEGRPVEVHAFQRLPNGTTMIVESGPARILEVDRDGKVVKELKLKVNNPSTHSDTRLARKLSNGHYLVCHERDGAVREYDADGKVVWEYEVPLFGMEPKGGHGPEAFGNQVFSALRLRNGNTLIATGNGHSVLEVTPDKQIVWSVRQNELPGITLAWVTTLQVLPNGHIVLGNCHAGPDNPQIVEITRDKKVVWTFKDFRNFGNALANSEVLDAPKSLR
ncbi:MAG TPA: arylsulfotransferase family protein [Armatimonadota bacterium]|nr:arylsulfotransferase family protein [Armatimonadota bacterium]